MRRSSRAAACAGGLRMVRHVAVVCIAVALARASPAWAISCPTTGKPNCGPCRTLTCDIADGIWWCDSSPKWGQACNDGNACTTGDVCQGSCVGTPITCTAADQCHAAGTCNPATGVCSNPNQPDGTQCNDGNSCSTADICTNGSCGGTPVTCTALDQCHVAGSCNPSTGTCSSPVKTGTPPPTCNDGNACTHGDHCDSTGACVGTQLACTSTACQTLACQGTSMCLVVSNAATSVQCNDANACTSADHCDGNGTCTGTPIMACTATPDRGCANPNKPPGTVCDDLNLCTFSDQCDGAGHCAGTAINPPCSPRGPCEAAACNGTSSCAYTPLPADIACPGVDDPCAACDGVSNMCRMP